MAGSDVDAKAVPCSKVDLSGKWQLDRNENFDEYMRAAGLGAVKRMMVQALTPVEEIELEDEEKEKEEAGGTKVSICTKAVGFKRRCVFTVGVEYGETHPMWGDKEQRVLAGWEAGADGGGGRLVQRVLLAPGDTVEKSFAREIIDGEMLVTMKLGKVEAKRYFKRI